MFVCSVETHRSKILVIFSGFRSWFHIHYISGNHFRHILTRKMLKFQRILQLEKKKNVSVATILTHASQIFAHLLFLIILFSLYKFAYKYLLKLRCNRNKLRLSKILIEGTFDMPLCLQVPISSDRSYTCYVVHIGTEFNNNTSITV